MAEPNLCERCECEISKRQRVCPACERFEYDRMDDRERQGMGYVTHGEQMNDYLSSGYAGADGASPDF